MAVRDLVIDKNDPAWLTNSGNVNWAEFAKSLKGVHYETLRKSVAQEREPTMHLMETVAGALGVEPDEFVEYQLGKFVEQFDVTKLGFDEALANFEALKLGSRRA